jgi:hypothetical protein
MLRVLLWGRLLMLAFAPLSLGVPSPGRQQLLRSPNVWNFDGDDNGVFSLAGQGYDPAGTWANPHTAGEITLVPSTTLTGDILASIVNRDSSDTVIASVPDNWLSVDLGVNRTLIPTKYSFRQRLAGGNLVVNLKFQGSVDNNNWTDLTTSDAPTVANDVWTSFSVVTVSSYRFFRIQKIGLDHDGANYFCIGEWELYGTLH